MNNLINEYIICDYMDEECFFCDEQNIKEEIENNIGKKRIKLII